MKTERPFIFVRRLNTDRPRRNKVVSEVRKILDYHQSLGQFVFIVDKYERVWLWGNTQHGPMFQTWNEFMTYYKNEPMEFNQ